MVLPPGAALARARELLEQGRCFSAHEVLEAVWKAAPAHDRPLWRGLAQVCVGLTHLQRGNTVGAQRLLERASASLLAWAGVDPGRAGREPNPGGAPPVVGAGGEGPQAAYDGAVRRLGPVAAGLAGDLPGDPELAIQAVLATWPLTSWPSR